MATIDLEAADKILRLDYEIFNTMIWCQVYYITNEEEKKVFAKRPCREQGMGNINKIRATCHRIGARFCLY